MEVNLAGSRWGDSVYSPSLKPGEISLDRVQVKQSQNAPRKGIQITGEVKLMKALKIVVTGPFNSGKTEFIRTISEIEVVTTERKITNPLVAVKEETTVAMDFGRVTLGDKLLHLFGTPGQSRFDFMWEVLSKEMQGFIVLADSTTPESFDEVERMLKLFQQYVAAPYLVVANKQDLEGALSPKEIQKALKVEKVLPCVATDKASVEEVLHELTGTIG
jgi:small GTP-binding protein